MEIQSAELLFIVSDNGGDYSHDIAFNQHVLGRLWRKYAYAWLACAAYAAGESAFNWEVEQQWTKPRRKLVGMKLGRGAVPDDKAPLRCPIVIVLANDSHI